MHLLQTCSLHCVLTFPPAGRPFSLLPSLPPPPLAPAGLWEGLSLAPRPGLPTPPPPSVDPASDPVMEPSDVPKGPADEWWMAPFEPLALEHVSMNLINYIMVRRFFCG